MTEIQKIKSDAKTAFDNCSDPLAFQTLWGLKSADDFISYIEKEDSRTNKKNWFPISDYFWTDFILQQEHFSELLSSLSAIQLLHHYFKSYGKCVHDFETKVAKEFPELFVKAIRVNQVFLQSERIEFLQSLELDEQFQIHQKFWKYCFQTDLELWKGIRIEFENVKQLPIDDVFCHLIIWLEIHRFDDSNKRLFYHLSKVYSFFIELTLSEYNLTNVQNLNSNDLFNKFLKLTQSIYDGNDTLKNSSVSKSLELIFAWTNFYENTVVPYCFDMNFYPVQKNETFLIKESSKANAKWKKGELRYKANELYYDLFGSDMVEYLEKEEKLVIPGKTPSDIELNRDIEIRKWATAFILEDIQHGNFKFGKKEVHTEKLLMPLVGFSRNRFDRYEKNLDYYIQTSKSWYEAFLKLTNLASITDTDVQIDPFILITENDYKKLNGEVFSEISENHTGEVLKLFSFRKNGNSLFNRFQVKYNVWHRPFVRFDNLLFTPTMFFANNDWFYTFTELALRNSNKSISTKMEEYLALNFKEKGLKVRVINETETNEIEGDVDLFVEDNDTLLFIQLKRTKFRLNPEDVYNEIINVDLKASRQLNNAEHSLKIPNKVYDTKGKQPVKWIVTTSYENVGESINGCRKVNYFDVLYVLRTFEIKSLKDMIAYIETDEPLNNFIELKKKIDLR